MGKRRSRSPKRKTAAAQKHRLPLEELRTEPDFLKYMGLLKEFAKKYCVMIVSSDTPVGPDTTQESIRALMELGLRTDLYGKGRCAYAAMIDAGQVIFEEFKSNTSWTINQEITVENKKVKLVSNGFYTGDQKGLIWIDGKNYSPNNRGLNIVVYDKAAETVLDAVSFDTFSPEPPPDISTFERAKTEGIYKNSSECIAGLYTLSYAS